MLLAMEIWLAIFFGLMALALLGGWVDRTLRQRRLAGGPPLVTARGVVAGV